MNSLTAVASEVGLKEATTTSKAKDPIVYYIQPDTPYFRVDLGARPVDQDIVVDLTGGFGPLTDSFKKADLLLSKELSRQFGASAQAVLPCNRIQ